MSPPVIHTTGIATHCTNSLAPVRITWCMCTTIIYDINMFVGMFFQFGYFSLALICSMTLFRISSWQRIFNVTWTWVLQVFRPCLKRLRDLLHKLRIRGECFCPVLQTFVKIYSHHCKILLLVFAVCWSCHHTWLHKCKDVGF